MKALAVVLALTAGCTLSTARGARNGGLVIGAGGLATGVVAGGFAVAGAEPYLTQSALLLGGIALVMGAAIFLPAQLTLPALERADARNRAYQEDVARRDRAWALTQEAATAAREGKCARVRELGAKVEAVDPRTRATVFAGDAAIARCLAAPPP